MKTDPATGEPYSDVATATYQWGALEINRFGGVSSGERWFKTRGVARKFASMNFIYYAIARAGRTP